MSFKDDLAVVMITESGYVEKNTKTYKTDIFFFEWHSKKNTGSSDYNTLLVLQKPYQLLKVLIHPLKAELTSLSSKQILCTFIKS